MTKNLFRILLFLLLPLAGQAKDADSLRVLWVGNSYTYYNDMPAIVQQIAATQKVKVSCTRFLKGGERFPDADNYYWKNLLRTMPTPKLTAFYSARLGQPPKMEG